MELLEVRNTSDHPVTLRHDREGDVVIPPKGKKIVNLAVAAVNFGNPAARNEGKNKLRDAEIQHVQTWWGFYAGMYPEAAWTGEAVVPLDGSVVGPLCPPCEVYDLETGLRVWMIHDDPKGEHKLAAEVQDRMSEGGDERYLNARIDQLQSQLATLLQIVEQRGGLAAPSEETAADDAILAQVGDAMDTIQSEALAKAAQTQAERNEGRDEIPSAPLDDTVRPDNPRTARSGARASARVS